MAEPTVTGDLSKCDAAIADLSALMRQVKTEDPTEYACLADGVDELLEERLALAAGALSPDLAGWYAAP